MIIEMIPPKWAGIPPTLDVFPPNCTWIPPALPFIPPIHLLIPPNPISATSLGTTNKRKTLSKRNSVFQNESYEPQTLYG
ncbi:hypothetical protein [Neobacillus drentensis]|uniref:hypothetical protein n=1 Tax=Neobacillus drentensis TaxID=220684 RepID=UPI002FFF7026